MKYKVGQTVRTASNTIGTICIIDEDEDLPYLIDDGYHPDGLWYSEDEIVELVKE